ncbi:MAG: hypothetical protein ABIS50_26020 [Luteolibacter sp.]|uniref:hypothetical protein n=1 Tax=Luteolibacter sp. TaxID=1962973 RepID=UPI003265DB2F
MTDKEKLQQLFQAALQDSSHGTKPLARAFPTAPAVVTPPVLQSPSPAPVQPAVVVEVPAPRAIEPLVQPMPNAGLDHETATELGALLDAQIKRKARRRRRELVMTLVVCFGLTGGGYGWFIQSPSRVQAFSDAMKDIRSVGDIKGMVAKYQKALDRVAARGQQIDQASVAMGVDPTKVSNEDAYFTEETKDVMKVEGVDMGARNKRLQDSLGKLAKHPDAAAAVAEADAAKKPGKPVDKSVAKTGDSFEWDK